MVIGWKEQPAEFGMTICRRAPAHKALVGVLVVPEVSRRPYLQALDYLTTGALTDPFLALLGRSHASRPASGKCTGIPHSICVVLDR